MRSVYRILLLLALMLTPALAQAAGPILFDCNEVLLIQGEYYTQPLTINLDRVIAMKPGKVAGERVTQIRVSEYIPNQFVWISIEGSFETVKQEMRSLIANQSSLDSGGFKPLPMELSSPSVRSATQVPEGALRLAQ